MKGNTAGMIYGCHDNPSTKLINDDCEILNRNADPAMKRGRIDSDILKSHLLHKFLTRPSRTQSTSCHNNPTSHLRPCPFDKYRSDPPPLRPPRADTPAGIKVNEWSTN
ncbi:hypothetical protein GWI33_014236 [Rhynchophorus ferrugineus]|uniref:Uncharacterized protein n=1 Tax=Rhynchophorus ferrugineus TaxID=354439 RepID=A0A834I6J3_RHYFE|nr:hypothetical protein GWI33_014236 [Rhynchophorus ferrugineus]